MTIELGAALGITLGMVGLVMLLMLTIVIAYSRGFDDGWVDAEAGSEDHQPQERD